MVVGFKRWTLQCFIVSTNPCFSDEWSEYFFISSHLPYNFNVYGCNHIKYLWFFFNAKYANASKCFTVLHWTNYWSFRKRLTTLFTFVSIQYIIINFLFFLVWYTFHCLFIILNMGKRMIIFILIVHSIRTFHAMPNVCVWE